MGKPPTTDQELTRRVAALEARMITAETNIVALDSDVALLRRVSLLLKRMMAVAKWIRLHLILQRQESGPH